MAELSDILNEKEQSLTVIAKSAFGVYRKTLLYMLPIGLAVYIPINIVIALVPSDYFSGSLSTDEMIDRFFSYFLTTYGLNLVFAPIVYAAATSVVKHIINKKELAFSSILDDSLFKWWKLAVTTAILSVIFVFGSFLIVPAIYAGVIFNFYVCAIVASDKWGRTALSDSAEVVRGRFFKTLGYICIYIGVNFLYTVCAGGVVNSLPFADSRFVLAIYSAFLQAFGIYFSFFTAVWYFNWERFKVKPDEVDNKYS